MIDTEKIRHIVETRLEGTDEFLVDVSVSGANIVEVTIDSDTNVDIDTCVKLSRAIEAEFDRETEDFELTVSSAGIGQPLRQIRQYNKLIGKSVEVVLKSGIKILARLTEATPEAITLAYTESRLEEGAKRKKNVEVVETYPLTDIKSTKEYLDFK